MKPRLEELQQSLDKTVSGMRHQAEFENGMRTQLGLLFLFWSLATTLRRESAQVSARRRRSWTASSRTAQPTMEFAPRVAPRVALAVARGTGTEGFLVPDLHALWRCEKL